MKNATKVHKMEILDRLLEKQQKHFKKII